MLREMHSIDEESLPILSIEPKPDLAKSENFANRLSNISRIPEEEAMRTRRFALSMAMVKKESSNKEHQTTYQRESSAEQRNLTINGKVMDLDIINHQVPLGDTEIWEIENYSMMSHPFHIHHGQFQILDRNGRLPHATELGDKDTVLIGPGESVRIIKRFTGLADPETPYMYHCHLLEHEDIGMMGQFTLE